jgi:hypothetical protein
MLKRIVLGVGAAALFAIALPTDAQAQMPMGKEATITGTVIDLSCKFAGNQSGETHKKCAVMCAENGVPLAILGSDGTLYVPISKGMPGSDQNEKLKEFAEEQVVIEGMVLDAAGAKAIQIESIKKAY